MPTFNNIDAEIAPADYTKIEDAIFTLKTRGFCFLENCVKLPFFYHKFYNKNCDTVKKVIEFKPENSEYKWINNLFTKSVLYEQIKKENDIYMSTIDLRIFKNSNGTFLHHDLDIFVDPVFNLDIFTCWTPLTNTNFETGTLAIVNKIEDKNLKYEILQRENEIKNNKTIKPSHQLSYLDICNKFIPYKYNSVNEEEKKSNKTFKDKKFKFFAKNLKIGDVAMFNREVLHCALDTRIGTRVSLDFRIAVIPNEKTSMLNFLL